jgi:tetratricopeptide (TPR) repeat protein
MIRCDNAGAAAWLAIWRAKFFSLLLLLLPFVQLAGQERDALAEYRNGRYEAAVQICLDEIKQNASNLESYVVICWSLIELKRYEEADSYAARGRAISRYDARIIEAQGEAAFYLGKNVQALMFFQEYISLLPEGQRVASVYYYIGEVNIRLERFRYADIALTTALHYEPQRYTWRARLAYTKEQLGELRAAAALYNEALRQDANFQDARRGYERVLNRLRG